MRLRIRNVLSGLEAVQGLILLTVIQVERKKMSQKYFYATQVHLSGELTHILCGVYIYGMYYSKGAMALTVMRSEQDELSLILNF